METRNEKFTNMNTGSGQWIDCEINHPLHGWIPCHINPEEYPNEYPTAASRALPADPVVITPAQVDRERDRRLYGGVSYTLDGVTHVFQSDMVSQQRIGSMAALARFAVAGGAQVNDYRWHGGSDDFAWITSDNSLVLLDAPEMVGLGDAFAAWVRSVVFDARTIKNLDPIPLDYADDSRWP